MKFPRKPREVAVDKLVEKCLLTPKELDDNKYWYDKYHGVRDLDAIQTGLLARAIPIVQDERDEDWYSLLELIAEEQAEEVAEVKKQVAEEIKRELVKHRVNYAAYFGRNDPIMFAVSWETIEKILGKPS
jgi:hypothetical protein